ncbi:MAG: Ca2+-binding EF-hand superfamily protein [Alphaproteobacteria bacterium]|jgi:Ca2+-binding EF-hand superfamily protein
MKKLTKILSITAAFTVLSALAMTANASDDLFTELDINADGTISITEAEAHEVLLANFAAVDIDSDGYVTKGELVASGIS